MKNAAVVVLFILSVLGVLFAAKSRSQSRPFDVPYVSAATAEVSASTPTDHALRRMGHALEQVAPGPLGRKTQFRARLLSGP